MPNCLLQATERLVSCSCFCGAVWRAWGSGGPLAPAQADCRATLHVPHDLPMWARGGRTGLGEGQRTPGRAALGGGGVWPRFPGRAWTTGLLQLAGSAGLRRRVIPGVRVPGPRAAGETSLGPAHLAAQPALPGRSTWRPRPRGPAPPPPRPRYLTPAPANTPPLPLPFHV